MYICMYVSFSLSLYIYIYTHAYMYICIYVYMQARTPSPCPPAWPGCRHRRSWCRCRRSPGLARVAWMRALAAARDESICDTL